LQEHIERVGLVFYERGNAGGVMKAGWQNEKARGVVRANHRWKRNNSPVYVEAGIPMLDSKHVKDGFVIDDTEPEKFISLATG